MFFSFGAILNSRQNLVLLFSIRMREMPLRRTFDDPAVGEVPQATATTARHPAIAHAPAYSA